MFWRTCPNDLLQGQVLATSLIGVNPLIKSVTVVYISDAYGAGLEMAFASGFTQGTVNLVPYDARAPMNPASLATIATTAEGSAAMPCSSSPRRGASPCRSSAR
jgi:ABC-type branched-subunit amino acid transport system substrate-binding protein